MPTRDEVIEALRQVEDPELGMDIVDLGLLYDVEVEGPRVKVTHSLTSNAAAQPRICLRTGQSLMASGLVPKTKRILQVSVLL